MVTIQEAPGKELLVVSLALKHAILLGDLCKNIVPFLFNVKTYTYYLFD